MRGSRVHRAIVKTVPTDPPFMLFSAFTKKKKNFTWVGYGKICGFQTPDKGDIYVSITCESRMFLLVGFLCHAALHSVFLGQNFLFLVEQTLVLWHQWCIPKANRLQFTKSMNVLWFSCCFKLKYLGKVKQTLKQEFSLLWSRCCRLLLRGKLRSGPFPGVF